MPIYEKSVRLLMRDMLEAFALQADECFTKQQALTWFAEHYPKIKSNTVTAHLALLSTNSPSRIHHTIRVGRDDLLVQLDGGQYRRYNPATDPAPIYRSEVGAQVVAVSFPSTQTSPLRPITNQQTVGNIGLFYVCYQLSRLGWNVMPTARNAKGIDILIYNQDASRTHTVQVKTLSRGSPVPLGKHLDHLFADFLVICRHVARETPECFVLTPEEVRQLVHRGEKDGKISYWLQPRSYAAAAFREQWNRIGSGLLESLPDQVK